MTITRTLADRVAGVLSGMKLTAIADKVTKNTLLKDFLAVRKIAKELGEEQQELVDKFNQEWSGHRDENDANYKKALDDVTAMLKSLAEEEVEVDVTPIGMDAFMVHVKDDILTFEQIAILQDGGLLG